MLYDANFIILKDTLGKKEDVLYCAFAKISWVSLSFALFSGSMRAVSQKRAANYAAK